MASSGARQCNLTDRNAVSGLGSEQYAAVVTVRFTSRRDPLTRLRRRRIRDWRGHLAIRRTGSYGYRVRAGRWPCVEGRLVAPDEESTPPSGNLP